MHSLTNQLSYRDAFGKWASLLGVGDQQTVCTTAPPAIRREPLGRTDDRRCTPKPRRTASGHGALAEVAPLCRGCNARISLCFIFCPWMTFLAQRFNPADVRYGNISKTQHTTWLVKLPYIAHVPKPHLNQLSTAVSPQQPDCFRCTP